MIFISILILIVAIALPSINKNIPSILFPRLSAIIFIYAGVLSFNAFYIQSIGSGIGIYSGLFHITAVSQLLDIFIFIIGSLILISWPSLSAAIESNTLIDLKKINHIAEYSLVVLFSTLGASLLVSSADLISMYLSIELQSFGVYILSTLYRDSESATAAGLKYFLLGGLSSCIILLGVGLIYSFTGLTNLDSIYSLISIGSSLDNSVSGSLIEVQQSGLNIIHGLGLGLILVIIGFLFKIAAAPLHNWAPDVYDDSPTIVTIWLTIMPKISIIIFLLEIITGAVGAIERIENVSILDSHLMNSLLLGSSIGLSYTLKQLILISSLLSLIIGTVVGLAQSKIKRLLAYSTISHIGFILLALAINTEQSIDSLIFYIMQYSITNLNTFLILLAISYIYYNSSANTDSSILGSLGLSGKISSDDKGEGKLLNPINKLSQLERVNNIVSRVKDIKYISELKGQFYLNPLLSLGLTLCLFSMAGIPPLLGFFSKQFVLYSAIQDGHYFMAIVAIVVSIISASYYLKIIRVLHSDSIMESKTKVIISNSTPIKINYKKNNNYSANPLNIKNSQGSINNIVIYSISNLHSFIISTLTLSILFFVLKPSIILNSTQLLALSLFNY